MCHSVAGKLLFSICIIAIVGTVSAKEVHCRELLKTEAVKEAIVTEDEVIAELEKQMAEIPEYIAWLEKEGEVSSPYLFGIFVKENSELYGKYLNRKKK